MKTNNNLDERQEQVLLKIEHNGCWAAFWGLLAVLVVEFIVGCDFKTMGGEWLVFMALSLYLAIACLKNGIWDRRLQPSTGTNAIVSVVSGLISGAVVTAKVWKLAPEWPVGSIATGVITAVFMFVIIFAVLSLTAKSYKKKHAAEEAEEAEEISE